jgi:hypothetical protein
MIGCERGHGSPSLTLAKTGMEERHATFAMGFALGRSVSALAME